MAPKIAFFLFGPRGTGKSTWTKTFFPKARRIDLLSASEVIRYKRNPEHLRSEVQALSKQDWIVLDEVQRVPELLDEVHHLMENVGYKRFVLTGSSARKLKRGASNLLAGRAIVKHLYPLNFHELGGKIAIQQALTSGFLPGAVNATSEKEREDFLTSYVLTYLNEEIRAEALVRNIGSFSRFLEIAGLMAGQRVNLSGLARDAEVSRETARGYFSVLEDTLLGEWLPAYRPRAKVKEVALPKFYWFDPGVLYALAGGFQQPLPSDFKGVLFEHWIHHEIRSYMHYQDLKGTLGYWSTPSGSEIDFLWWYGQRVVAIEVKSASSYSSSFLKGIQSYETQKPLSASFVVYLGEKEHKVGDVRVLPVKSFLHKLHAGEVIG